MFMSVVLLIGVMSVNFSAFAATDDLSDNSAAEANDELGAAEACDGHVLGNFSRVPACVNESGDLHICENNFPDTNLREKIKEQYSQYIENGYLDSQECENIEYLYLNYSGIGSLKGIEYFTSLKKLDCAGNALTELNLNALPSLVELSCSYNALETLDVSKLEKLERLSCSDNKLTTLELGHKT